jgi:hypothetical protein
MGADAFLSFYGIKISVDPGDDTVLNAIEDGQISASWPRNAPAWILGLVG